MLKHSDGRRPLWLAGVACMLIASGVVRADSTLFGGYDLVVFGNMNTAADVEGSAIIGGNLTGNSSTFAKNLSSALKTDDTLLIGGNDTSGNINLQNGSAVVDGTVSNAMNLNGGGTLTKNAGNTVINLLAPLEANLKSASMNYAALAQSANAAVSNGVFSVTGSPTGQEVFDVQSGTLFTQNALIELTSSLSTASAVIINVQVTGPGDALSISNSINLKADYSSIGNIIWNFYYLTNSSAYDTADSMSLTIANQFPGAVLAPYAALTNMNQIDGSVAVASFNQQGEVHLPSSTVVAVGLPEPLWTVAAGLVVVALWARRRAICAAD